MQHGSSSKEVGRIGLKERETELSSREGEGGQNLSCKLEREGTKKNELVLSSHPLLKPLCTNTNTPLSLIRA